MLGCLQEVDAKSIPSLKSPTYETQKLGKAKTSTFANASVAALSKSINSLIQYEGFNPYTLQNATIVDKTFKQIIEKVDERRNIN